MTFRGGDATVLLPHSRHTSCTLSVAPGGPSTVRDSGSPPTTSPSARRLQVAELLAAASTTDDEVAATVRHVHVAPALVKLATIPVGDNAAAAATPPLSYASTNIEVAGTSDKLTFAIARGAAGSRTRSLVAAQVHSAYSASACPKRAAPADKPENLTAAALAFSSVVNPCPDANTSAATRSSGCANDGAAAAAGVSSA